MFNFFRKQSTPKSSKQELIEKIGKQRYVNVVARLLSFATPGEQGSYERLKELIAAIESELRAAEASPIPFVHGYIRRVRNDPVFQQVLSDISREYYEEKYNAKSFVDFFALIDGAYVFHAKTEAERNLYVECRCLIVEKLLKIEEDKYYLGVTEEQNKYSEEYKQVEKDIDDNLETSKHLQEVYAWSVADSLFK